MSRTGRSSPAKAGSMTMPSASWLERELPRRSGRGDIFSVPYAAVWKCRYPGEKDQPPYDLYWMTVVLAADDRNPFDRRYGNFINQTVLTLADGRFFTFDYGRLGTDENGEGTWGPGDGYLGGGLRASDPLRSLYYFRACAGGEAPGAWCELSYPYGEPWSVRIDWREAEP